jgi:RNA polymerase sigma-70 factor (ECF subfamily)
MVLPGHQRNVQKLVDEYYEALYRYAHRLAGCAADAEDLTQETFCKAQVNLRQLRDPERAKAWLFRILRNAYLHKTRAEKNHRLVSLDNLNDLPERLPAPLPPVDAEQLQQALNELPEVFRTPIILYYFDDFSYRDIAEQMELPLGTVMSRLARAKVYLRARLGATVESAAAPSTAGTAVAHGNEMADGQRRATDGL